MCVNAVCLCETEGVVQCGGTRLTLIACSPSTPNLRASQACITAPPKKHCLRWSFHLPNGRKKERKKNVLGFILNRTVEIDEEFFFVFFFKLPKRQNRPAARQLSEMNHIPFFCPAALAQIIQQAV